MTSRCAGIAQPRARRYGEVVIGQRLAVITEIHTGRIITAGSGITDVRRLKSTVDARILIRDCRRRAYPAADARGI